jgi:soluble lytic murein transglycosylase-like protein
VGVEQYEPIIADAARVYNVDPELIRRMIRKESSGNSLAQSTKGAAGLMQLMPATAKDLGVRNILDPRDNIVGGTRYLRQLP